MIAYPHGRLTRAAVQAALLGCVLGLIWGGIWLQVHQERLATERDMVKETSNLALAFEENIVRSIDAIDQVLLFVRDAYARDPGRFDLQSWARERPFINDQTFQLSLIDASGMLLQSNLGHTAERVDLHDREHFRVQATSIQDHLFISRPLLGRVSNRFSVQLTRRIVGPDGEFLGVVVASLDPYYLARFYESLQIGHGFVMLVGLDGYLRAGRPASDLIGKSLDEPTLFQSTAHADQGSYWATTAAMTGRRAFVSYRRLAGFPLIVAVGFGIDEVFADYHLHRFQYVMAGTGLSALVLCVGVLLGSHRRQLAHYHDALTATLANMSQGIIMIDRDRRIAVINRRVGELLGLPPGLLRVNASYDDIVAWQVEHGEFVAQHDAAAGTDGLLERVRLSIDVPVYERSRPDGTVLEIRTAMVPNGGAVRTYTDISERRRNEQELAAARDAAEAAVRARAQFLAVMSHEIRTPLNGIIGAAALLLDRSLEPEQRHYVDIVRKSGDHLLQLINDILDFSRLDASCIELEEAPFGLRATIVGTVDMFAAAAREKGLDLRSAIAEAVPERAIGDAGRLRQVLLNLIGNAIKFTPRGRVVLEVSSAAGETDSFRLAVAVSDTGIGIPPDALGRLFQEFSQVDGSISRRFGGSGLGLAISRRLVERMGGLLQVDSIAGSGSTFRFEIMLRHAPVENLERSEATPAPRGALRRLRVLLVEDNDTNRLVASRMVERMGHRVDAVAHGVAAVQAVRSTRYDLVLMDIMMPEMDGLTATRLIRAEPGETGLTRIIGLTANAERSKEAACLKAGMNGFVSKPVTVERLAAAIDAVIPPPANGSPAASDRPLLAEEVLQLLGDDIGEDSAADVVRLFLTEAPHMVERLQQGAVSRGRPLLREVHTLASASRSVGLLRVGCAAADLEQAMATEEPSSESVTQLVSLLHRSVARLEEWNAARQTRETELT